jgi:hypothetical protein
MSQENVEIVRAAVQRIGPNIDRDDWIHEFLDAEIEWHDTPTYPSAGVYIGHEAFSRHAAEFEDAWADWGIEIEDIRAALATASSPASSTGELESRAAHR